MSATGWRYRCPEGHTTWNFIQNPRGVDDEGPGYRCRSCDNKYYSHLIDAKTNERTIPHSDRIPRKATEENIRDYVSWVLVGSSKGSKSKLHLGTEYGSSEPLCGCNYKVMKRKRITVYPEGYREWCPECIEKYQQREQIYNV